MPPCPHCGSRDSVYRNVRVSGYTNELFDELEYGGEMPNTDMLKYSHSKTLRCVTCGKIRRDVIILDEQFLMLRGYKDNSILPSGQPSRE